MGLLRLILKPLGCLLYAVGALAIALVLAIAAMVWAFNHYAGPIVKYVLESQTGYSIACQSADLSLWAGDFEAKGLRVFNPAVFGEPSFIECDRIFIDADPLSAFVSKTFLIHEADVKISRLNIVFNHQGENSLTVFLEACAPAPPENPELAPRNTTLATAQSPAPPPSSPTAEETPPQWSDIPAPAPPPPRWRIARLHVSVKTVRVQMGNGAGLDFNFKYERTFSQVTNLASLFEELRDDLLKQVLSLGTTAGSVRIKFGQ